MSFFRRLFKVGQSNAHVIIDKIEDPIKMTEQGIRDLKNDLQESMTSLAEVKGIVIRTRKAAENQKKLAADYERKAMLLLQKDQN
jgi:phage shock protein A